MSETSQPPPQRSPETPPSCVVGIGASAGGLSALEAFFDSTPPDTGMAFIVVQHLSPDFKSLMDDLLSRHTSMPITRVTEGLGLRADNVYLIPPKSQMTISGGRLHLTDRSTGPHVELPIDLFLNSLAADVGERAIGVILSGTGSDGSRGVLAVHKAGGLVLVQSPESAQFDGMPRSAAATGVASFILSPERMPRIIQEYASSPATVRSRASHELEVFSEEGEFAAVFALLRRRYSLDFSKYKGSTVGRRIRRRMEFRQIPESADYAAILSGDQNELELLYKDLLIGVTEFFRDTQAYVFLEREVVPRLFVAAGPEGSIRVWSAGCATGEEAYSLAILLAEHATRIGHRGKITVFATDVHRTSLDTASQGLYERERLVNVSEERLGRFFRSEGEGLSRVTAELRKMVVFAPHNLLSDPPFTKIDLVCCRNVLIYFQPAVQERVISLFHFSLEKDGALFLGSSEGLGAFGGEFEVLSQPYRVFAKLRDLKLAINLSEESLDRLQKTSSSPVVVPAAGRMVSIERQVLHDYDLLLGRHIPPGLLVDQNRAVLHYFGNVAEYLRDPEGRAESNVLNLVEDTLHFALSSALMRAEKTLTEVLANNLRVRRRDREVMVDLRVTPLPHDQFRTLHFHVSFEQVRLRESAAEPAVAAPADAAPISVDADYRQHVAELEGELQSTRETLQTTVEELQTANEELQATNEELLAANEELQSTNEELHSVNEELYSVNSEFERKNVELKQLDTDHENLLASISTGTIFLDRDLRIRKFNPAIATSFKLLPQDLGRPIDHIAYHLSDKDQLLVDVEEVLRSGQELSREERTRDDRDLLCKTVPFRTERGQIEGVVITFSDITTQKEAERRLQELNDLLERKVEERTSDLRHEVEQRRRSERQIVALNEELEARVEQRTAELQRLNRQLEGVTHSLSHELRAPIARLEGFSRLLLEESACGTAGETRHFAERIQTASRKLQAVIDSILQLNRLTRSEMRVETVDISELAAGVLAELNEESHPLATVEIAPGVVVVGDREMLTTLMRNLLSNALKYSSRNDAPRVAFGSRPGDGEVVYFVQDNGTGFDMAFADKLFAPFMRLHQESEFPGSGVGLAIAHQIVQRHGGRIWADSVPGEGATFSFTLGCG